MLVAYLDSLDLAMQSCGYLAMLSPLESFYHKVIASLIWRVLMHRQIFMGCTAVVLCFYGAKGSNEDHQCYFIGGIIGWLGGKSQPWEWS